MKKGKSFKFDNLTNSNKKEKNKSDSVVAPKKEEKKTEQKYKTLRWYEETHKKAKLKATMRGMTIVKYLDWLIDQDKT